MNNNATKEFQEFYAELYSIAAPPKENFIDPKKILHVFKEVKRIKELTSRKTIGNK